MNPPFSIIFMTTLIGMGQGLFVATLFNQLYQSLTQNLNPQNLFFYGISATVTLVLLMLGLIASIFHLGRPERAWRSAACWRTSWLSREVIALPACMLFVFLYALLNLFPKWNITVFSLHFAGIIGFIGLLVTILLFVCTSMIYICLRFLQEWHTPLTFLNFMLKGLASGFVLAAVLSCFWMPSITLLYVKLAIAFCVCAATSRISSLIRNHKLKPKSTIQTALGIKNPAITQMAQGASAGSFNTREFFHRKSKLFFRSIKWIFLVMVFLIPLILLVTQLVQPHTNILILTLVIQYVGLIAERWYFFAEAKHPQNLYYQAIS